MEDFARVEYCVMDKSDNNIEVFSKEEDAIKFAKDNNYFRVLEVGYGEPDEHGDENELYATEIWSLDEDFEVFEGTAYYDDKFRGVADVNETSDYGEIESWAWNMLQQGLFVEIKNMKSGKSQRLTPDDITEEGINIKVFESASDKKEPLYDKVARVLDEYGILYGDIVENEDGTVNLVGIDESEWEETRQALEDELSVEVLVPDEDHEEFDDELIVR